MPKARLAVALLALAAIALSVWKLETARAGLVLEPLDVGTTPATAYRAPDATGPVVIVAHGFAGSRQLMEALSLTLARAGYVAVAFDFEGHGRNPVPMSGDTTRIEGTTQRLLQETRRVMDAALAHYGGEQVALAGHSMASDIIIRQAIADDRVAAVVAISPYSEAITATEPARLAMVSGEWEPGLRAASRAAARLVDPMAREGATVRAEGVARAAFVAPSVEHVGVLYSATTLRAATDWLDETFGRSSGGGIARTGGWIALLLLGVLALAWPLAALLPRAAAMPSPVPRRTFLLLLAVPPLLTPLALNLVETRVLPVLVADYLALHLLLQGLLALGLLYRAGVRLGPLAPVAATALAGYGLLVFGLAMDRYAASFVPHDGRVPIVLAIAVGAVPFMIADALATEAGQAPLWRRLALRGAFFASLGLAVALDFEGLFFLLLVTPVLILFFAVYGLMGRWVARRSGSALAPGIGLGVILAWSIGVTFPLFSA